ncbi:hypothetical protein [Pelotomaculum sp. PtaB.Bin117]|uniref:hypothetical protein n=1 Tax=Pelotomaculum sp. PtaB.Bin117 TaxID=1811694 RepID=UPI0009D062C0|nr:hypothetical protein [Pelotomaculum sp. PtaB.Bin117]OPX86999.1 MAG: hypothetical protein A4E54_01881 [Pelotomaculum sp. PtaB.Bin117]
MCREYEVSSLLICTKIKDDRGRTLNLAKPFPKLVGYVLKDLDSNETIAMGKLKAVELLEEGKIKIKNVGIASLHIIDKGSGKQMKFLSDRSGIPIKSDARITVNDNEGNILDDYKDIIMEEVNGYIRG